MAEDLKKKTISAVSDAIKVLFDIDSSTLNLTLQHPDPKYGDYASNAPLVLSKILKDSPISIGEKIVAKLNEIDWIDNVNVVAPGFVNISLKLETIIEEVNQLSKNLDQLRLQNDLTNKRVIVEFGQPNTHKIPHIGHLFSYIFGESLSRLLETHDINVIRANYQGDVGLHVAKCLWAYMKKEEPVFNNLFDAIDYLQKCYQIGSQAYEDDKDAQAQIKGINTKIYLEDPSIMPIWEKTRGYSVDYYDQFNKRLGVNFVKSYFESQSWRIGEKIVMDNLDTVFERSQGAIIFDGEKYGLHKRVFINQLGNTTYEAKDLGLAALKRQDLNFDYSIMTTAVEQNEYFKVLFKALELVDPFYIGKLQHIGYGMINLKEGKMSSRTGQVITAIGLIETAKEKIKEFLKENRDYSGEEVELISEKIGLASIKYSFLKVQATKNIEFSLDQSINFEGNSAAYIMYAYVRAKSVFREGGFNFDDNLKIDPNFLELTKEETELLKELYKYPEVIELSVSSYSPHVLCQYLYEVAQKFNQFYMNCPILKVEDNTVKQFRLELDQAAAKIIAKSFYLLGIETLEKL